jgi:hypothetical protein
VLAYKGKKFSDFSGQKKLSFNEMQESISRLTGENSHHSKHKKSASEHCLYCTSGEAKHSHSEMYFKKRM